MPYGSRAHPLVHLPNALPSDDSMPRLGCTESPTLSWGSHLCAFYRSATELQHLVSSYIQTGLDDHEGCLWILPPSLTPLMATTALQRMIPHIHDHLRAGQLELIPSGDWYHLRTSLHTEQPFAACSRKLDQWAARFLGIRVTGDLSWVKSTEQWAQCIAYERMISRVCTNANILSLCTYPAAPDYSEMVRLFDCHQSILQADLLGWRKIDAGCKSRDEGSSGQPLPPSILY